MRKIIIGVMGRGENATANDLQNAYILGQLIAKQGWVLLTGGRNVGVMDAVSKGAKSADGLTIGILPGEIRMVCPLGWILLFSQIWVILETILMFLAVIW